MKILKTLADFTIQNCIAEIIEVEGGYVNNADDRGGETKYGITKETANRYKHLWAKREFSGDMKTLSKALAYDIYMEGYWLKNHCSQLFRIHPLLAYHIFDMAVNSGNRGNIQLQELLNVLNYKQKYYSDIIVDGSIGNATIDALKAYKEKRGNRGIEILLYSLLSMQASFYINISKRREANETFTYGWLRRAIDKIETYRDLLR